MLRSDDPVNDTRPDANGREIPPPKTWPVDSPPIGSALEAIRGELCELGAGIAALLDGPAQTLVQEAQRRLESMVCRIAVIGQVKAGKSSVTNCLVRHPTLLPTDVNPWTTAVTRLHFARRDAPRAVAAEFRFFDADEWKKLAEGGGRIRELTERLVPGFDAGLLARHLETMRKRATSRLGGELGQLLGKSHTFATVDHNTLEAYVCSGARATTRTAAPMPGHYSDVTKSADLYLGGGTFGIPTTIIDTPGTNDPFLVRDEITWRSLDTADLYIVVLTARQALSTADIALLRILRGLCKERVIVFVNRIDELDNLESELPAVRAHVENGLRREFGGVEIPVVYGSALWASHAITCGEQSGSVPITPALRSFAARLATTSHFRDSAVAAASARSAPTDDPCGTLFVGSGMPQLAQALNRSILRSHAADVVRHLTVSFTELARLGLSSTRDQLGPPESGRAETRETRELIGKVDRLQTLAAELEQSVAELESALTSMAEGELRALDAQLRAVVERFAQTECLRLSHAMQDGSSGGIWRCDTAPLRQQLEDHFWRQFRATEAKLLAAEADILPSLRRAMIDLLPSHLRTREFDLPPTPMRRPTISALGRVVALDLDEPWWRIWWTGRRSEDERMRDLDRIIRGEFAPIAEALVQSARERLMGQISATARQTGAVCLSIVGQLRAQGERQDTRTANLATGLAASSTPRAAALDDRLKSWSSICSRLETLSAACARLQ